MRSAVEEVENDQVSNRVMTRSTSNQKKFMDDYTNCRMTRSAFKQQHEQKGDEKPQQQQQKKRKRKNKKKKPVVDDTPKISWGSRYMRYFTPEEREAYQKKLKESEGFDVGKYTTEVALSNPISEISLEEHSEVSDFSTEAAKMAIRGYNRKKRTKYEFVKLVKVCIGLCTGWMYYITFQAKQDGMAPSPPRNFQARVHNLIGIHVQFCREEKKPQLTEVKTHNKVIAISIVNLFWDLRGQRRLDVGAWPPRHTVADPDLVTSHYGRLALLLNPHHKSLPSPGVKTTNGAQTTSASENNNNVTTMMSMVVIVGKRKRESEYRWQGKIAVNGRGGNTATKGRGTTVVARGKGNTTGRGGTGNSAPRGGRENTAPKGRGGRTPTLPSVMIRERGPNTNDNGGRQIAATNGKGKEPMVGNGKQPNLVVFWNLGILI
ncbi:hypothetical protein RHMOL_Rhmol07G0142700 [Rhododendron molle]|uniref:Uncharacterized protein n=1 Tax=Rhododendron molle TaxID=49168 RepID=A0ACC0N0E6_RHOML|nr:hypothetical protein RHMOL_Rhmol07G0142700 [Rhododendron molle]